MEENHVRIEHRFQTAGSSHGMSQQAARKILIKLSLIRIIIPVFSESATGRIDSQTLIACWGRICHL
jgi:hypothetical protein